jgi:hypothetical protein
MQWATVTLISIDNKKELQQVLYTAKERNRKYIEFSFVKTDMFINRYKALIVKFFGLGPEGEMSIGGEGGTPGGTINSRSPGPSYSHTNYQNNNNNRGTEGTWTVFTTSHTRGIAIKK